MNLFEIISKASITFNIILFFIGLYGWIRGIFPPLYRLGYGLANHKIAIFAKGDNGMSLTSLLTDSSLFKQKNIFQIPDESDLGKAEKASIFLVHWDDWKSSYKKIIEKKTDGCTMIIYATHQGSIPSDAFTELRKLRNTMVCNFRGRLLNDIVTAMMTTAYNRKHRQ